MALLTACEPVQNSVPLIEAAKNSAAKQLLDSQSAKFRNVRLSTDEDSKSLGVVCGEVDGTLQDGTQLGFTRFIYAPVNEDAVLDFNAKHYPAGFESNTEAEELKAAFAENWKESCG